MFTSRQDNKQSKQKRNKTKNREFLKKIEEKIESTILLKYENSGTHHKTCQKRCKEGVRIMGLTGLLPSTILPKVQGHVARGHKENAHLTCRQDHTKYACLKEPCI